MLNIEVSGHGPPLVLVHGWAMHGGVFAPLLERLQAHCECWVVDLPGHGRSGPGALEGSEVAEQLLARVPPAHWLGWSLGGLIALHAALGAPARVHGVIAVASSPRFVIGPDWPHAVEEAVFAQFGADLATDYPGTIDRFLLLEVNGDPHARRELRWLRERLAQCSPSAPSTLINGLALLSDTDLTANLPSLEVPSLWIAGQRDRLVPWEALQVAAALAPGGQFVCIDGAGHAPFLAQPERVAQAVIEFVMAGRP